MEGRNMKASEAMRLGAMLSGQAFGLLEASDGRTCAMGALRKAVGLPVRGMSKLERWSTQARLKRQFPILAMTPEAFCPGCRLQVFEGVVLVDLIVHLNNDDRWSRERIADLVQKYEERAAAVSRPTESDNCPSTEELVAAL